VEVEKMDIQIFGSAGFAKEVYTMLVRLNHRVVSFVDDNMRGEKLYGIDIIGEADFEPTKPVVIGIGRPPLREKVVQKLLNRYPMTRFPVIIDPLANILNPNTVSIGRGSIICAGLILTTDIKIGDFCMVNINATVGHDCIIGDYNTIAPGASISGHVETGKKVYFGAGSTVKEHINICDDVTVGMLACVTKNIEVSGTYVGIPAKIK
jgi:sugar O-acyltransferase (sialic acid O-acetyltransferase NeuD family)